MNDRTSTAWLQPPVDRAGRPGRVIFIGLDAAEPLLLQRWAREGALPAIAALLRDGQVATPACPAGLGNGGTWPAVFTGMRAGANGRYFYQRFDAATDRHVPFDHDCDYPVPTFWELAGVAGKRVAVVDMMRGSLAASINGIQIADWLTHGSELAPRSKPAHLIDEVIREFGADPWDGHSDNKYRDAADKSPLTWFSEALQRVDSKGACSQRLMAAEPWDIFATTFAEMHDYGHLFWHLHDPTHPDFDAESFARHGDLLKAVYCAVDRWVGRLVDQAGPDTHVVLFTGPGMGPNYSANRALDEILLRLEAQYSPLPLQRKAVAWSRAAYKATVPESLRIRLNVRQRVAAARAKPFDPHSLSTRLFFPLKNNDNAGAVRLNLVGRESRGRVTRAEAAPLLRRLVDDLRAIVNAETGEPLIHEIVETGQTYSGALLDQLPDLFLVWNRPKPIRKVASPKIGRVTVPQDPLRTGDHNDRMLLAFRPARDAGTSVDCASIRAEDIAPTLLDLADVCTSLKFDGVSRVTGKIHTGQAGLA